jgi:hypothetical protein
VFDAPTRAAAGCDGEKGGGGGGDFGAAPSSLFDDEARTIVRNGRSQRPIRTVEEERSRKKSGGAPISRSVVDEGRRARGRRVVVAGPPIGAS